MGYSASDFASDVTRLICVDCPKAKTCGQDLEQLYWCVDDAVKQAGQYRCM